MTSNTLKWPEPGVGIRAARPGPKTYSPNRAEPDFDQPDRAKEGQPDPDPIGLRASPIFFNFQIFLKVHP